MAAFSKYALRFTGLAGLMGLMSCIPSSIAETFPPTDAPQLAALDLQPLEYRLDVPGRGQVVTTSITFTEFMDSEGFDYGAVVYLPTHDTENGFDLIHQDINGDNFDDVLVPLMVLPENEQDAKNGAGGGYFALAAVINQQGQPIHRDTAFFGIMHEMMLIDDQVVVLGAASPGEEETTYTYRWTEAGLSLIDSEVINLDTIPFPEARENYFDYDFGRFSEAGTVDDPLALTRKLLGTSDAEGGSEVMVDVLETTDQRRIIGYSQHQLGDDSVYAQRLRLEFVAEGDQWRIDWVGKQVSCQPGRGRQAWHSELCF